jgi:dolichyl-phosphate-mannose-protein mannosyltransferase
MRSLPAIFGILLIPTSYLTLRALSCTITTSLLAALLITFENALVAQSRLILLDSPLILFTATTILFFARFANEDNVALGGKPFGKAWWRWLAMSGLSLGAVASCKWVGLFTIATVGLATVEQLWTLLGNLKVTPRVWMKHFMARAACLIVLPVMVYMFTFRSVFRQRMIPSHQNVRLIASIIRLRRIHFWVLNASGEGDGFMSSEFQHTLEGHGMADTYAGT